MSFSKQESIIQSSLTKSHMRYLSPQLGERNGGSVIQRETIVNPQLRESQFLLSSTPRETVIPLDVQYTVTKKVDQQNFSDYEVRIQSLLHEVELWRKRYLDLMAIYDKNIANEEVIKLQEAKIQLLYGENNDLYAQNRSLMKENDELKQRLNTYELHNSIEETKNNYENLQVQLKSRLGELDEWRDKYNKLENQLSTYQGIEIKNMQVEGQLKGLEGQANQWQDRYWEMVDERNKLQNQIFELNERLNAVQIEAAQRNNATEIKLRDAEILKLKNLIQHLQGQVDEWRKKTLQMETEVELKQQDLEAQKMKVVKLQEQQNNLSMTIQQRSKLINEQNLEITNLQNKLLEINVLNQEIGNLNEMLQVQQTAMTELRKEISRLENNCGELRHEKLLKIEFESENKRLIVAVEELKQIANDRKNQLDSLKIKYGNLEIEKNQIQQRLEETKYLTTQIKQLNNENQTLIRRVKYLEDQIEANKNEIQDLQARIQQLKLFEIENKKLNELIILKDNEIQNLRRKLTQFELQPKSKDTSELEARIKSLLNVIEQLKAEFAQLQEQYDKQNKQNMLLSQQMVSIEITQETRIEDKTEINQWTLKSNQLSSELDLLSKLNQELQTNCDFLNDQMRLLQKQLIARRQEVEDWRRQAGNYYVDATEAKKQLKEIEAQQTLLNTENSKLINEIKQLKNQLIDEQNNSQKISLQSIEQNLKSQGEINQMMQDLQYLKIQLQIKTEDCENQRRKYLQSEQLNHDLKGIEEKYTYANAQLTQSKLDNERLNQLLREQSQSQPQSQNNNESNEVLQQQLQQLQSRYDKLQQEYLNTATQIPLLKQELADKDLTPLQKRIDELLKENQKLTLAFQNKVRECEELRSRCNTQESRITDLRFLEKSLPELQGQNRQLQQQIEDQLNEMTLLNSDIDKLNQKIAKYQLQLKNYQILQNEYASLKSISNVKDQDIAKLKTSNYLIGTDLENTQKIKQEYVDKYEKAASEKEEIKATLTQLQMEVDRLNNRLGKAEVKALEAERLGQKVMIVEGQLGQSQEENFALQTKNQQLTSQVKALLTQNENQEFKINQLIPFRNQWEDLQNIVQKDQNSLANIQVQLAQATETANQYLKDLQHAQEQLKSQEQQIQERSKIIVELEQANEQHISQLNQFQKRNNEIQEENFQLKVTNQNAILRLKKLEAIETDYAKIIEDSQQLQDQCNDLKDKLKIKEAEAAQFQYWKESLESRVALLASEIERQKHMVKTKNDEIDNLKEANQRLETLVTQLSAFEGDARRSEEQIIQMKGQIDTIKQNLVIKQKECEDLKQIKENVEQKNTTLLQDIDSLKSNQLSLSVKSEDLIQEVQRLQNECNQMKQFNGIKNELESKIQALNKQQDELLQQLQSKNRELLDLKQKLNDYDSQNQIIKQLQVEEQKLQLQIVTQNKEKEEWHAKMDLLQRQIEKLEKSKNDLENKCALLAGQLEVQIQKYSKSQGENSRMNDQIIMLTDDNDRLTQSLQNALIECDDLRKKAQPLQTSFIQNSTIIKSSSVVHS
ncbi:unnamed protein product [Paramecium primaurelia]|uniref:Uncharacterized protein n=1 Tax=Paramecium primaurelia TaxID=5886 RepID=A0A8S1NIP5_PARPR|nr:unnamed protein product [Paramecium primaurelia]